MVKRRATRRKIRGGAVASCALSGRSGETSTGSPKMITILEDEMRVASPEQMICYGDTFTTCQTLTIVMQDNWKVGVHINGAMYTRYDNATTFNPETVIPMFKTLLNTHPKFIGKTIKYIYLASALSSSVLQKRNANSFFETLNNSNSMARLPAAANRKILRNENNAGSLVKSFFTQVFGADRITDDTEILDIQNKQVQHRESLSGNFYARNNFPDGRKNQHFYVFEDGSLELVYEFGAFEYPYQ